MQGHLRKVHPNEAWNIEKRLTKGERESIQVIGGKTRRVHLSRGAKRVAILGVSIILLLTVAYLVNAIRPQPRIQTDHTYYDMGTVPQTKVSHTFSLTNVGNGDLKVERIWTSCGCTSAKMIINGFSSPEFGMPGHGGYGGPWSAKIRPGETADLVVFYDSTSMPDIYKGERYVYVDSDDPSVPELQFTIAVKEIP